MNFHRAAAYALRFASWFGAIVLIALTSSSIKEDWGGWVYVSNAAFLLAGGVWLGDKLVDRLIKGEPEKNLTEQGPENNFPDR